MKIIILSCDATLYSSKRLVEASLQRNYEAEVVNPTRCCISIGQGFFNLHSGDQSIIDVDAVIPRIGPQISISPYIYTQINQLEMLGAFSLNRADAIKLARDKLRSLQLLSHHGFDVPSTAFAYSPADIPLLLKHVGTDSFIIKFLEGTQGVGVVLCESYKSAEAVLQSFMQLEQPVIVQEYIKEAVGTDIRCFVIGDQVVGAMRRQAQLGEFRSNLHRGGTGEAVEISSQERALAIKAAKLLGLHVAGIDLLRSRRGPLILEVNASPGLEGIESVTKQDIAGMMIDYVADKVLNNMSLF